MQELSGVGSVQGGDVRSFWSAEEDQKLREMWAGGISSTRIGQLIGRGKNAIIGRIRRLGLPQRGSPIKANAHAGGVDCFCRVCTNRRWRLERKLRRPKPPAKLKEIRLDDAPRPVRLVREPRIVPKKFKICQWIAGEPSHSDDCKCGAETFAGAYCLEHYRRSVDTKATAESIAKAAP